MALSSTAVRPTQHPVTSLDAAVGDQQTAVPWAFARAVWLEFTRIPDYHDEAGQRCRTLRRMSCARPGRG
jgi:hypothetical protein